MTKYTEDILFNDTVEPAHKAYKKLKDMQKLVQSLNHYRDRYYNEDVSEISDERYDELYDELLVLENETGIVMPNSPTVTVGYEVRSELRKVEHSHLMLSLDKTKSIDDILAFFGDKSAIAMLKMDGLTCTLHYVDGNLVGAETRGNGKVGEDILHNVKTMRSVPKKIHQKGDFVVDGEIICDYKTFEKFSGEYKNPRNFAAGSARLLDSKECATRGLLFAAWDIIGGDLPFLSDKLYKLENLKFVVAPYKYGFNKDGDRNKKATFMQVVEELRAEAVKKGFPHDGIVFKYDNVNVYNNAGRTGHHFKGGLAYKFYDEKVETILEDVRWTMGKTGALTPTAIFAPVDIDGTTVGKASVHNVSVMGELNLAKGDRITVYKANMIIPQIDENLDAENHGPEAAFQPPKVCPLCGHPTKIRNTGVAKVLYCENPVCEGKLLGTCSHFVSREAMNILGLSENILSRMIDEGYINDFIDIYSLWEHEEEIAGMEGFGEKSAKKLLQTIEGSKDVTLDRFLYSLCIPLIGRKASSIIAKECGYRYETFVEKCRARFKWSDLEDFGELMENSLYSFFDENEERMNELAFIMRFKEVHTEVKTSSVSGKTFVVTGKVFQFKNRDELKAKIEELGGKVSGSVSKNTDYLINNDVASTSGKNKKAKELGVPIISEDEFLAMIK